METGQAVGGEDVIGTGAGAVKEQRPSRRKLVEKGCMVSDELATNWIPAGATFQTRVRTNIRQCVRVDIANVGTHIIHEGLSRLHLLALSRRAAQAPKQNSGGIKESP